MCHCNGSCSNADVSAWENLNTSGVSLAGSLAVSVPAITAAIGPLIFLDA